MSTLWISVLVLVGAVLAAVVAFNVLQARRNRLPETRRTGATELGRKTRGMARTGAQDDSGPVAAGRVEPRFDSAAWVGPATESGGLLPVPASGQSPDQTEADSDVEAHVHAVVGGPTVVLDPRFDCIAEFEASAPVSGDRLLSGVATIRRAGSKPLVIEAAGLDSPWQSPQPGALYRRVRAAVLLANRSGPLNAMEYDEFLSLVDSLAGMCGVEFEAEPSGSVLARARALDEQCLALDAQIGLNIETPEPLSTDQLAGLALHLGLTERGNNRFAALGAAGEVVFSLALGDRSNVLTLLLDVPRSPESEHPWAQMLECARECERFAGGRLIDDAGRPLTGAAAESVQRELQGRYRVLAQAGLASGSAAALRVFN